MYMNICNNPPYKIMTKNITDLM